MILLVNSLVRNRWFAFQVTCSCSCIIPVVTPPTACSFVLPVEIRCKSMLLLKSNTISMGHSINVLILICANKKFYYTKGIFTTSAFKSVFLITTKISEPRLAQFEST